MNSIPLKGFLELASALGKPIVLFDLESTTFRGRPNFGITEAYFLTALPSEGTGGGFVEYGSLVNPEAAISPEASQLTGITQGMVNRAKPWTDKYLAHFQEWAPVAYFTGFNILSFDIPAVRDQAKRYGATPPEFAFLFDVRKLHLTLSKATSTKGTLGEVAAFYQVKPRGDLHRAKADVYLTAETLNAIVKTYGVQAVVDCIRAHSELAAAKALTPGGVAQYVETHKTTDLSQLAAAFGVDQDKVGYEFGRAIDEGLLGNVRSYAKDPTQCWLGPTLLSLPMKVQRTGRLKSLFDAIHPLVPPGETLDYVQLRIALLDADLSWTTMPKQVEQATL